MYMYMHIYTDTLLIFIYSTSVGGGANEMTSSYFTAPNTGARPRERGVMTGGVRERLTCSSSGDNPLITSVITSGRTSKVGMIFS